MSDNAVQHARAILKLLNDRDHFETVALMRRRGDDLGARAEEEAAADEINALLRAPVSQPGAVPDCSVGTFLDRIRSIDPEAKILWSPYTRGYYIDSRIEDGSTHGILCGITEHRRTPFAAIEAYWNRLVRCTPIVIGAFTLERRELVWKDDEEAFVPFNRAPSA